LPLSVDKKGACFVGDVKMEYKVEEILPLISEAVAEKKKLVCLPSGKKVRLSNTLKTFHYKGIVCIRCGLRGVIFREIKHHDNNNTHLRLLGIKDDNEVMMTRDHIIPYSRGGSNNFDNIQTMCCSCNSQKQDEIKKGLVENSVYSYKSIKDYVFQTYGKGPSRKRFSRDFSKLVRRIRERRPGFVCGDLDEILQYLYHIKITYGFVVPLEKLKRIPKEKQCLFCTQSP
jgi:hypothetical protein